MVTKLQHGASALICEANIEGTFGYYGEFRFPSLGGVHCAGTNRRAPLNTRIPGPKHLPRSRVGFVLASTCHVTLLARQVTPSKLSLMWKNLTGDIWGRARFHISHQMNAANRAARRTC